MDATLDLFQNSSEGSVGAASHTPDLARKDIQDSNPTASNSDRIGRRVDLRTELRLLHTHRQSHVAETGTLVPRVRRPTGISSIDWSSSKVGIPNAPWQPQPPNFRTETQPAPAPPPTVPVFEEPVHLPERRPVNHASQTRMHQVAPAQDLGRILPLGEWHPPFSSQETLDLSEPVHLPPRTYSPKPQKPFQHNRNSDVLRKINPTFEILHPGTLNTKEVQPVSSGNGNDKETRRHSRKLHKERPSGEHKRSSRSSFIDVIYGSERHPSQER